VLPKILACQVNSNFDQTDGVSGTKTLLDDDVSVIVCGWREDDRCSSAGGKIVIVLHVMIRFVDRSRHFRVDIRQTGNEVAHTRRRYNSDS